MMRILAIIEKLQFVIAGLGVINLLAASLVFFALSAGSFAQTSFSKEEILLVQQELSMHGYDAGVIDGSFSWQTAIAITQYQADWQLAVTATLDEELISRLERKHEATKPRWEVDRNKNCKVWNAFPLAQETMTYTGDCSEGIASGKGRIEWSYIFLTERVSDFYEGDLLNGRSHGQGTFSWANGDRYQGHFLNGDFSGWGVYESSEGMSYKGNFKNDKFHGTGVLSQANGDRYEGEFHYDKLHGTGLLILANGDRYEGEFKDDLFDGHGDMRFANGNRYQGEFRNGLFHGKGFFTWANGNSHEGEYRDGKPHGFGIYFTNDVESMRGDWQHGCLEVGMTYRAVGTSMEACGFE